MKRPFSLIEVIISLGLISLLIGSLFFWYRSLSTQKETLNQLKGPILDERYAFQRLQHILPKAELPFFSGDDGSLVFFFDRGPCQEIALSNVVLARLYYDAPNNSLCLGIWPKPSEEEPQYTPCQTLILLDHVTQCSFEFYHPPDLFKKTVDPEEVGKSHPQEKWQTLWKSSWSTLPALVKILVKRESDFEIEYIFDLRVPIIYPDDKL